MADKLKMIRMDRIKVGERFRVDLGDIADLAESIKDKGVIQPITVSPLEGGYYELLAGCRRYTAGKLAELQTIPALIREIEGEIDLREIELIENVWRKDPEWDERARLIKRLDKLCREKDIEWSSRRTAQLLNRGAASVSRDLQLAAALEIMPELAQQPTQDQAFKLLKAVEEQAIVGELRRRQHDSVTQDKMIDKGLQTMLKIADTNYRVLDTFAGMAELKSKGMINLIECDPPYGIDLTEQKRGNEEATSSVRSYNEVPSEAYEGFLSRLSKELFRVAGEHCWLVFWYGPTWHTQVKHALGEAGWLVDDIPCIWNKRHGQTMQPNFHFGRAYEPFFLARKGTPAIFKPGRANVFDFPPVAAQKKYHPTERPIALMESLLESLVSIRSVVFVPFLGSGVTLRACYRLGLPGWGYDMSSEYKDKFMLAVEEDTRDLDEKKENRPPPEGVRPPMSEEEKKKVLGEKYIPPTEEEDDQTST